MKQRRSLIVHRVGLFILGVLSHWPKKYFSLNGEVHSFLLGSTLHLSPTPTYANLITIKWWMLLQLIIMSTNLNSWISRPGRRAECLRNNNLIALFRSGLLVWGRCFYFYFISLMLCFRSFLLFNKHNCGRQTKYYKHFEQAFLLNFQWSMYNIVK